MLKRGWQALSTWYLDHYRLVALIEVPPISGSMSPPPLLGPLSLAAGPESGPPGSGAGGGAFRVFRGRRR